MMAAPPAQAGVVQENQFETSITLFSTLAAINAAGYDADLQSKANYPIRQQVRDELAKKNVPSLAALKAFYQAHRKSDSTADLSQYISFALLVDGPPTFAFHSGDITAQPPDVAQLAGFNELLAKYYKEANLEDLWNRSQVAYQSAIQRYQEPVIQALMEANGYLRNPSSGFLGRRFQILLDLLGAPNQVQVRSYRDDYYVVITPSFEPVVDEIRSAYLSYLLDPLSLKYSKVLDLKKELQKYTEKAPALPEIYKNDFSLLSTKSLIKAVESRLIRGADKKQAYVDQAAREGYILTPAFADLLPTYEKQEQAMRIYYPDMVMAIDVGKEKKRLNKVEFVATAAQKIAPAPSAELTRNPAEKSLETAEALYEQHDYQNAKHGFQQVLGQTTEKTLHGKAYYGLARVAIRQNQKDEAVDLLQKVIQANPDPAITAWSHIYLGRLAIAAGDPQKAGENFRLALAIDGASAAARAAAEKDTENLKKTIGEQNQ